MPAVPWPWPGKLGYPAGEAAALMQLSLAAYYAGDLENAVDWARQACRIDPAAIPGWVARTCGCMLTIALIEAGEVDCRPAQLRGRAGPGPARQATCRIRRISCGSMAELDLRAGRMPDAGAHLREALRLAVADRRPAAPARLPGRLRAPVRGDGALGRGDHVVGRVRRLQPDDGLPDLPQDAQRRQEPLRKAAQALGPARMRAAEERGAAMTLATAAEFAIMLTAPDSQAPQPPPGRRSSAPGSGNWSPWSPRAAPTPRSPPSCTSA